ncbi:class I tRNA ligase family protein, partial [Patescibacteria group bacterium]|nr:class I tRNA ligase family protein [Patescibacteria group bacterium]
MDKAYEFQDKEKQTYAFWEKEGFFTPKIDKNKRPYVITLPPPNVTGELHLGHALYAIEDILIRYNRMLGKPTLWL